MAKKIFAFIMAVVLACTALAGCTAQKDADTAKENITTTKKVTDDSNFKLSYTQADSLDPFKSKTQNNQVLSSLVFESLFDIDENWESVPNIATKYEFSDGKTLKVSFNPSLTFSDGSPIESDDIIYSFNAAKKSPAYKNSLKYIGSASAGADNTIVFYLKITKDFNPYITTINLVNIAAADSIDNAVNIGNISYAFRDLSSNVAERMTCNRKLINMNNLVYIGVNSLSGITANAQIRKAISLACDRNTFAESAYNGYGTAATSPFNPQSSLAQNVKIFSSEADTSTAKQAIAQSGIDSKELKLNILVNKNDNRTACAALLKNQLEAVGFTVTIDEVSTKEYTRRVKGVEFNLYIGEVKLSDDMSLYPFFDDNSGGVRYGIDNKSLTCDDLYCAYLSGEADLGKFILAFNEEMPYIPLIYKKGMLY